MRHDSLHVDIHVAVASMNDMTNSYMWHASFPHVTCSIHSCDMTHCTLTYTLSQHLCETWPILKWDEHSWIWHSSLMHATSGHAADKLSDTASDARKDFRCAQRLQMRAKTCSSPWLQIVGSLKLQVSFAEYRPFNRALMQKRPVILWRLQIKPHPTFGLRPDFEGLWCGYD